MESLYNKLRSTKKELAQERLDTLKYIRDLQQELQEKEVELKGNMPSSVRNSVAPKVRLQGYGYNPFCSHSTRCLAVLV